MSKESDYSFADAIREGQQGLRHELQARIRKNMANLNIPQTPPQTPQAMQAAVIEAIRAVYDPEIPVNLYDLGLIYSLHIDQNNHVNIEMTLTAPACPVAGEMPLAVEEAVKMVPGVSGATAILVFDPPWDKSRMSEAAQLELGLL